VKILYVITLAEPGGASSHLRDLLFALNGCHHVALVTGEEGFLTEEAEKRGIPLTVLPSIVHQPSPARDMKAVLDMRKAIRRIHPSIIHAHTFKAGLVSRLAAFLEGVPSVYTPHAWSFLKGTPLVWKAFSIPIEAFMARIGQKIICVSCDELRRARRYHVLSGNNGRVIYNGIAKYGALAKCGDATHPPQIIMVARFVPQKDHRTLLRAVADIKEQFELLLVGDGPGHLEIERMVVSEGLKQKVHFLGARNDVPALLSSAHIAVLSSSWEGSPIFILEAMRSGLPVVASRVGGVPELVSDNLNGFLFRAGDVISLRECILKLIREPRLRESFGKAGRRIFEERFTLDKQIESTLSVYEEVLEKYPPKSSRRL
jgi:glycosyltransferase involved in cell wall biosynthesis